VEHFDELVTDHTVRLADVEAHLATLSGGMSSARGKQLVMPFWMTNRCRERIGFARS
jgi:hypothetical protein